METQPNKIIKLELDDLKNFEPVGSPQIVVVEGDWRPCNSNLYSQYLETVEQKKPERARGFVEGAFLSRGVLRDEIVYYLPIQYYRQKI